jgi:hypothetical protein
MGQAARSSNPLLAYTAAETPTHPLVGMASVSPMLMDLVGGAVVQPRWTAPAETARCPRPSARPRSRTPRPAGTRAPSPARSPATAARSGPDRTSWLIPPSAPTAVALLRRRQRGRSLPRHRRRVPPARQGLAPRRVEPHREVERPLRRRQPVRLLADSWILASVGFALQAPSIAGRSRHRRCASPMRVQPTRHRQVKAFQVYIIQPLVRNLLDNLRL